MIEDTVNGLNIEEYLTIKKVVDLKTSLDSEHRIQKSPMKTKNCAQYDTAPGFVKLLCPKTMENIMTPSDFIKKLQKIDINDGKVNKTQLYTGLKCFIEWSDKCYDETDETDITANNMFEYYKLVDKEYKHMSLSTFSTQISKIYKILVKLGILTRSANKPYYYDWNSEFWILYDTFKNSKMNFLVSFATFINNEINANVLNKLRNQKQEIIRCEAPEKIAENDVIENEDSKLNIHYTSALNIESIIENLPNGSRIKIIELDTNRIVDIKKN